MSHWQGEDIGGRFGRGGAKALGFDDGDRLLHTQRESRAGLSELARSEWGTDCSVIQSFSQSDLRAGEGRGGERRSREGSEAGAAGFGGGGISDQSDAIPSVLQRNSKESASPSPPTLPRWCCFKYGSAGLNAELGDLLQKAREGGEKGNGGAEFKGATFASPPPQSSGNQPVGFFPHFCLPVSGF